MVTNSTRPPFENRRSLGFPKSNCTSGDSSKTQAAAPPTPATTKSLPLKKQAKGRWFISCVIGSFLGFIGYTLWNELGRYQAFGEIEGTIIHVAPLAAGRVASVEVDEGDYVRAGQLLAIVDARELQMNLQKLRGEFQIALSNLSVRLAEVRERSQTRAEEHTDRRAEYYKLLGDFHDKQAKLEELSSTFETYQSLRQSNSVSEIEFVASKSAHDGLKLQIADLKSAIATLEPIVNSPIDEYANELIQSEQSRVQAIQSELAELQSLFDASRVLAPVAGRVIKRHCQPGEYVAHSQPMLELLQEGSVKGIVYLPQPKARLLQVGDNIALEIVPLGKRQVFRVERISPELATPPSALQSNYRAFKGLARVHTVPLDATQKNSTPSSNAAYDLSSWIGAELALPRFFFRVGAQPKQDLALDLQTAHRSNREGL